MNVIKPSIPMRSKPIETVELETECLFGEVVEVLDNYLDWFYCRLLTDNYLGWVKKKDLGYLEPATHRVISKRSFLYKSKDVKYGCIDYLPLGAQLSVKKIISDEWAEINLTNTDFNNIAYVPINHIVEIDNIIDDWVAVAENLIGTPYVWGGRDSIGIDCSALLQLSFQTYGENIPRNTADQYKLQKKTVENKNTLERGNVVFWDRHVGIMVDQLNCIHANAFHMETVIEPLINIKIRIGNKSPILKIMNFNNLIK